MTFNLSDIPYLTKSTLSYVMEDLKIGENKKENELWLEFGVYKGKTINYISKFTEDKIYGFDSFEGLPEDWRESFLKGEFNLNKQAPTVNDNVELIKGWFNETLENFIQNHNNKSIGFIHIDCDLYSSTKYVLDTCKNLIKTNTIIVFDELLQYPGFDGDNGELRALVEWVKENEINFEWIGQHGETAGLKILKI